MIQANLRDVLKTNPHTSLPPKDRTPMIQKRSEQTASLYNREPEAAPQSLINTTTQREIWTITWWAWKKWKHHSLHWRIQHQEHQQQLREDKWSNKPHSPQQSHRQLTTRRKTVVACERRSSYGRYTRAFTMTVAHRRISRFKFFRRERVIPKKKFLLKYFILVFFYRDF